jgi:hypothetical protein
MKKNIRGLEPTEANVIFPQLAKNLSTFFQGIQEYHYCLHKNHRSSFDAFPKCKTFGCSFFIRDETQFPILDHMNMK